MLTDPTPLYRIRDGVYAPDLLTVAVTDLDLFSWLERAGGAGLQAICHEFGIAQRPVDVLSTYVVALGLAERSDDHLWATQLARDHFVAGSPHDLRPYYRSLRDRPGCDELLGMLRTGEPAAWASAAEGGQWEQRLDDPSFAATITAAMDARGQFLGPRLAESLTDLHLTRVLDVGGGSGIYLSALIDRFPHVHGAVFERAPIDAAARTLLGERGHATRVQVITGDMFDQLPRGYDLHLFSHVLHDWDDNRVRQLLRASFDALEPGGWLVDHDVHVNADKTGPLPASEYSVFLMHATHGKCWSVSELDEMLRTCGFDTVSSRDTAGDRSVVVARKPSRRPW